MGTLNQFKLNLTLLGTTYLIANQLDQSMNSPIRQG